MHEHISSDTLEELVLRKEQFDAITMFEVIEHLEEFSSVIDMSLSLLRPGGIIIISAPNSKMCWRPKLDYPPHHLSRFSSQSLHCLMKGKGLNVIFQEEQTSLFDLFRNFLGSLMRKKSIDSMRGGAFYAPSTVNKVRAIFNKYKWSIYVLLSPVDKFFKLVGVRYISQIVVAKKEL